jgi:hypothetical protein
MKETKKENCNNCRYYIEDVSSVLDGRCTYDNNLLSVSKKFHCTQWECCRSNEDIAYNEGC